jgi:hypothetical protein
MSSLNVVDKSDTGFLPRDMEMNDLSSNFQAFKDAFNYSKTPEDITSFITPSSQIQPTSDTVASDFATEAIPEFADEAASMAESVAEAPELGPLAAIGAIKATGDMASNAISSDLSSQFSNVNIANSQAHGLDAVRQSSMVNQADQQSLSNANFGMSIGSWFGPIGSYLGYAFSNTNVASNLNMNTGFGQQGMVNPELNDSVSTSYASQEASDNQSVISL